VDLGRGVSDAGDRPIRAGRHRNAREALELWVDLACGATPTSQQLDPLDPSVGADAQPMPESVADVPVQLPVPLETTHDDPWRNLDLGERGDPRQISVVARRDQEALGKRISFLFLVAVDVAVIDKCEPLPVVAVDAGALEASAAWATEPTMTG
jgi:hypothetical protein